MGNGNVQLHDTWPGLGCDVCTLWLTSMVQVHVVEAFWPGRHNWVMSTDFALLFTHLMRWNLLSLRIFHNHISLLRLEGYWKTQCLTKDAKRYNLGDNASCCEAGMHLSHALSPFPWRDSKQATYLASNFVIISCTWDFDCFSKSQLV